MPITKAPIAPEQQASKGAVQSVAQSANYLDSIILAGEQRGRLPLLREFLTALGETGQYDSSRGHCYWLGDSSGFGVSGPCRFDPGKGTLTRMEGEGWDRLPPNEQVYIYPHSGNGPFMLRVSCGGPAELCLWPYGSPGDLADRVAFVIDGVAQQPATQQPAGESHA